MWPSPVPGQHSRGRQRRLPVLLSPEGVRAEPCPPAFALRLVNFSLLHKTQEMLELGASESLHMLLRAVSPTTLSLSDSISNWFSVSDTVRTPHTCALVGIATLQVGDRTLSLPLRLDMASSLYC